MGFGLCAFTAGGMRDRWAESTEITGFLDSAISVYGGSKIETAASTIAEVISVVSL